MKADDHWTPPLRITLEDLIWDDRPEAQHWARVVGLALVGSHVLLTLEDGAQVTLDRVVPVRVRRPAGPVDDGGIDESAIAGTYAGDVGSAGVAVADHARVPAASAETRPGVPAFTRDPELVGIYGGDLDHVMDAMGTGHPEEPARTLREEETRKHLADAAAHPPVPPEEVDDAEAEEANAARIAGWYAGDLSSVMRERDR